MQKMEVSGHEYYKSFWQTPQLECQTSKNQLASLLADPENFIPQRTPEWYAIRKNVLTASSFYDLCITRGATGAKVLNEKLYPEQTKQFTSTYGSTHSYALFHGCRCESVILPFYEWITGRKVYNFGLVKSKRSHFIAASPDGVNDAGMMVEFKCPVSREIIPNKVPPKYLAQIYGQLYACQLKHCDYFEAVIVRAPTEAAWKAHKTVEWWSKKAILIFTINADNGVDDNANWVSSFTDDQDAAAEAAKVEWRRRRESLGENEFIETYYCIVKEVNHVAVIDKNSVMEKHMLPRLAEAHEAMTLHRAKATKVKALPKLPKFSFDKDSETPEVDVVEL